jgi:hypothetical protein
LELEFVEIVEIASSERNSLLIESNLKNRWIDLDYLIKQFT